MADTDVVLRVADLAKHYPLPRSKRRRGDTGRAVQALDGVSFSVRRGETVGVVGESGCGKTTLARTLVVLERPTRGAVFLDDRRLSELTGRELVRARARVQMIFQDPYASLSPRMNVRQIIGEGWRAHPDRLPVAARPARTAELLTSVGLEPAAMERYPHQFSGGQRQRIGIARALAVDPDVLVCDEPTSGLDVSVQSQVLNLLARIQRERHLSMVFIGHDLTVIRHVASRIVVMYLGKIVEVGPTREVFAAPRHPYTRALLSAVPSRRERGRRILLGGEVPSPINPPSGCRFRTRCWKAQEVCAQVEPTIDDERHGYACHFPEPAGEPG
jgi:oligopeptide transport system ATP-binding protein